MRKSSFFLEVLIFDVAVCESLGAVNYYYRLPFTDADRRSLPPCYSCVKKTAPLLEPRQTRLLGITIFPLRECAFRRPLGD